MRRTALLACLVGAAVLGGGYLALGAAGEERLAAEPDRRQDAAKAHESTAKLPPLPKKLRARVVQPEAGAAGVEAPEPEQDPGLDDPSRSPRGAASRAAAGRPACSAGQRGRATRRPRSPTASRCRRSRRPRPCARSSRPATHRAHALHWGGGHGKWQDTGYDCSGSVSFALAAAGLLDAPLASGPLMSWGEAGKGKWVTIYANDGHVFLEVAGIRFDTSATRVTGSRWSNDGAPPRASSRVTLPGFSVRGALGCHPMHARGSVDQPECKLLDPSEDLLMHRFTTPTTPFRPARSRAGRGGRCVGAGSGARRR